MDIGYVPQPAGRGYYPISIVKASCDPVGCPVFGEQIAIITASLRPKSVAEDAGEIFHP